MGGGDQGDVERKVIADPLEWCRAALEARQRLLHVRQIVLVGVFCSEGGSLHFEHESRFGQLASGRAAAPIFEVEWWEASGTGVTMHERASAGFDVDEAAFDERAKCFADNRSADSEVQRQLPFGREPALRCELTGQHPVRQCCGDRITGPPGENHDSIVFVDLVDGRVA